MSGMYPNNQTIEIFGEQVSWPGVDTTGKFTNGSFSNPMVKPSFIPAETMNLILDNLESIITKCGGTPNATSKTQIATLITSLISAKTIVMRDEHGRAQIAAPEALNDIARLADIKEAANKISPNGYGLYSEGRNLMTVLGVSTILEAIAALKTRCVGTFPNFSGLQIGDYIDGIDLSAIPAENGGTAGQPWNNSYKNNRIVLSAFNPYKGLGPYPTKNHIRFDFQNIILKKQMNAITEAGGYLVSDIKAFLEGVNGDGTGDKPGVTTAAVLNALKAQIGNCILPVWRYTYIGLGNSIKKTCLLFIPNETEIIGENADINVFNPDYYQPPLYRDSLLYRVKTYNGARESYFLANCYTNSNGYYFITDQCRLNMGPPENLLGISPAFCISN